MSLSAIDPDKLASVTGGFDFSPIIRAKDDQLKLAAQRQQAATQSMTPSLSPLSGGGSGSGSSDSGSGADGAQKKW